MKHLWLLIGVLILSAGVIGCSSEENDKPADSNQTTEKKENEGAKDDSNEENTKEDENTEAGGKETGSKPPVNSSKGKPKDQENLKVGDTAVIQSTLGTVEITFHSSKKVDDVKGTGPQRAQFLITELEIKNVGDNNTKAIDWVNSLEMVWDMEGDGSPNDSDFYEVQAIEADLAPGESTKGEAIFDVDDSEEYYLMVDRAVLVAGNVYNNAVWTFSKNEMK